MSDHPLPKTSNPFSIRHGEEECERDPVTPSVVPTPGPVPPKTACAQVHAALALLPLLADPAQVPMSDGLYFFYEEGERSADAPLGRVVRVGNHPRSQGTLKRRLGQHYRGDKNQSVFRKLVGGALLRRETPDSACLAPRPGAGHWELQNGAHCGNCRPLEERVSGYFAEKLRFR